MTPTSRDCVTMLLASLKRNRQTQETNLVNLRDEVARAQVALDETNEQIADLEQDLA